ncbi:flavin reductase family protein [Chelativorans intermedius]|uniref:Flavin reductase family protein n=1 Tax=Chelativorans intermedius TaxID=515947 RepID=A0ABV6D570_9HYPH|nr:flavin reductase family protein [Chelativorans intermedius]MCT8997181.1 flavin reductase family protein [Chelativorans intermedius]
MFYEPKSGHGLPHDPFKAIVAPRPIGWISTRRPDGRFNLAPYSFFNAFSSNPYLVWFSSEGEKDSASIARQTGEFAVNLVSLSLAGKMNETAIDAPPDVSEFDLAGLTPAPCRNIACPRVAEAAATLECKVTEVLEPRDLQGRHAGVFVVTGEVVGVHVDDSMLVDGLFDVTRAQNLARLGYMDYAAVTETFSMRRPRWKDR